MDWFRDNMWATWLIIATVRGVHEQVSMHLLLIKLAGVARVGMVAAVITGAIWVQILAALAAAMALLAFLPPAMVPRLHAGPTLTIGAEALIGKRADVLEAVSRT